MHHWLLAIVYPRPVETVALVVALSIVGAGAGIAWLGNPPHPLQALLGLLVVAAGFVFLLVAVTGGVIVL
jgi:hypothetical protein